MEHPEEFPRRGYFYIRSKKNNFVLDVFDAQTKKDVPVIVWPQKLQDNDNQLWRFENGRLINKNSNLALDYRSIGTFKKDRLVVQNEISDKLSQLWAFKDGFIYSEEHKHDLKVFDIRGDSTKEGAEVLLYKRKDGNNLNQLWYIEPVADGIEEALSVIVAKDPLHKSELFGLPRPGYGAEVGVPPELKEIPANTKVAGLPDVSGNNSTDVSNVPTQSPSHPRLAEPVRQSSSFGSFYSGTTSQSSSIRTATAPMYTQGEPMYPPVSSNAPCQLSGSPEYVHQPPSPFAASAPPPPPRRDQLPPSLPPREQPRPSSTGEPPFLPPRNQTNEYPPPSPARPPPSSGIGPGGFYVPPPTQQMASPELMPMPTPNVPPRSDQDQNYPPYYQ